LCSDYRSGMPGTPRWLMERTCDAVSQSPLSHRGPRCSRHKNATRIDGWLGGDLTAFTPNLRDWGALLGLLGTLVRPWLAG
jgi:hypothetical protein